MISVWIEPVAAVGGAAASAPPPAPAPPVRIATKVSQGTVAANGASAPQLKKHAPAPQPSALKTRWIPYAVAAILTFCISLAFLSRQSMHASQTKASARPVVKSSSPAALEQPVVTTPPKVSAPVPPVAEEVMPASEPSAPKPSEEQILLAQVKALWASGKYAQALTKVDDLLEANPDFMEGRIWKKKIRSAQEAEAAMK